MATERRQGKRKAPGRPAFVGALMLVSRGAIRIRMKWCATAAEVVTTIASAAGRALVESDQMAQPTDKRTMTAIGFLVAYLAFAVVIMCITGPMMALSNPCETLQTTAVATASTTGAHVTADQFSHVVLPALGVPVVGFPELVPSGQRGRPTTPRTSLSFISTPLRA